MKTLHDLCVVQKEENDWREEKNGINFIELSILESFVNWNAVVVAFLCVCVHERQECKEFHSRSASMQTKPNQIILLRSNEKFV